MICPTSETFALQTNRAFIALCATLPIVEMLSEHGHGDGDKGTRLEVDGYSNYFGNLKPCVWFQEISENQKLQ